MSSPPFHTQYDIKKCNACDISNDVFAADHKLQATQIEVQKKMLFIYQRSQ